MLAFVYWTTPAALLPNFMPGYEPGMLAMRVNHGIAAFAIGIACFLGTWLFGKKKSDMEPPREDSGL